MSPKPQLITSLIVSLCLLSFLTPSSAWRSMKVMEGNFGKACTNGTVPEGSKLVNCDRATKAMVCSESGKCECAPSESFKTEFDLDVQACLPVPSPDDDFRCQTNYQCTVSLFGTYSRCNADIAKCECYAEGVPTEQKNHICYKVLPPKMLASFPSCQNHDDCTQTDFGNLTRCNLATMKCECYDTNSGKNDVRFYNGRCVFNRVLGDFCENDDQCRAGNHKNAMCTPHQSFLPGEKVCQCPGGQTNCDGNGGGGIVGTSNSVVVMGLSTILLGIMATRVIT